MLIKTQIGIEYATLFILQRVADAEAVKIGVVQKRIEDRLPRLLLYLRSQGRRVLENKLAMTFLPKLHLSIGWAGFWEEYLKTLDAPELKLIRALVSPANLKSPRKRAVFAQYDTDWTQAPCVKRYYV